MHVVERVGSWIIKTHQRKGLKMVWDYKGTVIQNGECPKK